MALLSVALLSAPTEAAKNGDRPDVTGIFDYNQNIVFSEIVFDVYGVECGVDIDQTLFPLGTFVNQTYGTEWLASKGPVVVAADWSDDLILHEWKNGQKVRTEVVLRAPADLTSVYTTRAHFTIEKIDLATGVVLATAYDGNVSEGLYADGPTDAYSAEINQLGQMLYGYNWDTKTNNLGKGFYKLTFSIETTHWMPDAVPFDVSEWTDVTISSVADYDLYWGTENCYAESIEFTPMSTSIVIELQ
jgi:hypothetical protein